MPSSGMRETLACSFQLGFSHGGYDAGEVCLLQDLGVGYFVLPANAEKGSKSSEMEVYVVKVFFM